MPTDARGEDEDILDPAPIEPFNPLDYLFTAATISGARTLADALGGPAEVWELDGRYYPVRRNSNEAGVLRHHGAELVPPQDDALHMSLDPLLAAVQRLDAARPPGSGPQQRESEGPPGQGA